MFIMIIKALENAGSGERHMSELVECLAAGVGVDRAACVVRAQAWTVSGRGRQGLSRQFVAFACVKAGEDEI